MNDNMDNINKGIITLDLEENTKIKTIISNILANPTEQTELFCEQTREMSNLLPNRIKEELIYFSTYGSETGYLLIKNIDLSNFVMPTTPLNNNSKIGELTEMSKFQALFISVIGEMIAYEGEGYGGIFQDVVPIKRMENVQTSLSSKIELEIHTEQAFSLLRPDILSLACLKGDTNAMTYILPVQKIIDNLTKEELLFLREPNWMIGVDLSFKLNGIPFIEGDERGPIPILYGSEENPKLVFDQDLMKGINEQANEILKKIVNIYYENRLEVNLKSGDIILIDNNRATHGRSSFTPKYNGNDRFLIRCFCTFDYKKSAYARLDGGRIVQAIYS